MHAAAGRAAHNDRRRRVPEIMALGDEIGELVEAASDEVDELHLADGTQAEITHAAGRADDGAFADGSVDHALPAEALEQAFAGLERAAINTHVFADDHYGGVAFHFLEHGLLDGFEESDGAAVVRFRSVCVLCSVGL